MSQQAQQLITQAKAEGWKRLDLGNCGLTDLEKQVPELFELTDLEELVLSNEWHNRGDLVWTRSQNKGQANHLSRLPQSMAQLKQLKVLICCGGYFGYWAISDYSVVQSLPHLTRLDLSGNKITRIENLDKLTNLFKLSISFNKFTKIGNGSLGSLTKLQELCLSPSPLADRNDLAHAGLPATCKVYL